MHCCFFFQEPILKIWLQIVVKAGAINFDALHQLLYLFPLWYHDQPKLVPSPQYTSITLRYTIGDGNFQLVPSRHYSNPENTNVPWRLPNVYPESYDWGLPDHRLVDWPHGLTSLDRPRGLAGGHRSGHELLPRMNKQKWLNMRRNRTWWNDKTLQ